MPREFTCLFFLLKCLKHTEEYKEKSNKGLVPTTRNNQCLHVTMFISDLGVGSLSCTQQCSGLITDSVQGSLLVGLRHHLQC